VTSLIRKALAVMTAGGLLTGGLLAETPSPPARDAAVTTSATGPGRVLAWQDAATKTIWSGVYTEEQARRGEQVYKSECSYCHRDDLAGGFLDDGVGRAAALAGPRAFGSSLAERWKDLTVVDMVATIAATMPEQKPASLTVQAYVDVVSYLFSKNNIPAGSVELPVDVETLGQLLITQKK
jgi:mono/diheme cytochrome c family protein